MTPRISTISFSSQTGLGVQSRDFVNHMHPDKVLIDDLSAHNGMPVDHSWCPSAKVVEHNDFVYDNGYGPNEYIDWLTDDVDILVVHETPLNHGLYKIAREKGVKTLQVFNYEFIDGYKHPDWPRADYMGAPTSWKNDEVNELDMGEVISWPVPVDRQQFPGRAIGQCETMIHIIGRPTYMDRNGTIPFLKAAYELRNLYKYKVFLQEPTDPRAEQHFAEVRQHLETYKHTIELIIDTRTPQEIYSQGEVLVLPRRYGGLCLPMQEALSSGLPTIMTDIRPNYDRLPKEWLVPSTYKDNFFFHAPVDVYDCNVSDLALKMLQFADPTFMARANRQADQIADQISWETLKPYYDQTLETICQK